MTMGNILTGHREFQPFSSVINMKFIGKNYKDINVSKTELTKLLGNRPIGDTTKESEMLNIEKLTESEETAILLNSIDDKLKNLTTNKCQ